MQLIKQAVSEFLTKLDGDWYGQVIFEHPAIEHGFKLVQYKNCQSKYIKSSDAFTFTVNGSGLVCFLVRPYPKLRTLVLESYYEGQQFHSLIEVSPFFMYSETIDEKESMLLVLVDDEYGSESLFFKKFNKDVKSTVIGWFRR